MDLRRAPFLVSGLGFLLAVRSHVGMAGTSSDLVLYLPAIVDAPDIIEIVVLFIESPEFINESLIRLSLLGLGYPYLFLLPFIHL